MRIMFSKIFSVFIMIEPVLQCALYALKLFPVIGQVPETQVVGPKLTS